ncbi:uncharacterized protein LOC100904091 isoform X2 [Galendromus occidentalis]|uniref:Uncharacterized protein LOC100904091 isoform X2 n=1 Tax=Galendromus occidentalis TaxID=34638 RepID=A0AAJ6QVC8_9ACAR|nr:uncharacterized protein LOC100904091 isoform X2 [Galendromus occidentalis]
MKLPLILMVLVGWTKSQAATEEPIRTDLITKTVLAINASIQRSVEECDNACQEIVRENAEKMTFDEKFTGIEAKNLIKSLRQTFDVDWSPVQAWLRRLEKIQKTYFDSVLKYADRDSKPVKEALFYLEMGEIHNATSELLANQKTLMGIVADLSAILEIVQKGRSGLALKLAIQLGDLKPYHETFGCAHNVSGGNGDGDCAAVMRRSFTRSFQNLQETLKRFFVEEMVESHLLDEDDDSSNEDF